MSIFLKDYVISTSTLHRFLKGLLGIPRKWAPFYPELDIKITLEEEEMTFNGSFSSHRAADFVNGMVAVNRVMQRNNIKFILKINSSDQSRTTFQIYIST